MNDRQLLDQLDQRARAAGADLGRRAAERPRPDGPNDTTIRLAPAAGHRTRGLDRRWLAVAAAIALVAGGIAIGVAAHHPDHQAPAHVSTTDPQPYLATELPKGYAFAGAADPGAGVERDVDASLLHLWGPSPDAPGLVATVRSDLALDGVAAGVPVPVGSRTGYGYDGLGIGEHTLVVRIGHRSLLLASPTLGDRALASIAERATVSGDRVAIPASALPSGWAALGSLLGQAGSSTPFTDLRGAADGLISAYTAGTGTKAQPLYVQSQPGDVLDLAARAAFLGHVRRIEVRGHDAVLGQIDVRNAPKDPSSSVTAIRVLSWIDAPGDLLTVGGSDLSASELERVAAGLRVPAPGEWDRLVLGSKLGDYGPDAMRETVLGRGTFADRTPWVLRRDDHLGAADRSLDLTVAMLGADDTSVRSSDSGGVRSSSSAVFPGIEAVQIGDRLFGSGVLDGPVARVELRDAQGSRLGDATVVVAHGFRAWVAELPTNVASLVAIAADGHQLGTMAVSNLGGHHVEGSATATTVGTDRGSSSSSSSGSGSSASSGSASSGSKTPTGSSSTGSSSSGSATASGSAGPTATSTVGPSGSSGGN